MANVGTGETTTIGLGSETLGEDIYCLSPEEVELHVLTAYAEQSHEVGLEIARQGRSVAIEQADAASDLCRGAELLAWLATADKVNSFIDTAIRFNANRPKRVA